MMPRERITFERCKREKSPSGQEVRTWSEASPQLKDVPVERRKRKAADGMNANEDFTELTLTLWARYDESMDDTDLRIAYGKNRYAIVDIERNFHDNTCLITCKKINE